MYHPQEEKAAESFGFPEFIPAEELDLKLTDEERRMTERSSILVQGYKRISMTV